MHSSLPISAPLDAFHSFHDKHALCFAILSIFFLQNLTGSLHSLPFTDLGALDFIDFCTGFRLAHIENRTHLLFSLRLVRLFAQAKLHNGPEWCEFHVSNGVGPLIPPISFEHLRRHI